MKVCGLIVEYNPFHNGHAYHAQQARDKTQADVVIAVMSGNFLQRGELAITDKWTRAKIAAQYGVDLVIELPVYHAVQPADFFAQGAIDMLFALGCDVVCFGTDEYDVFDYEAYGAFYQKNRPEIEKRVAAITSPEWTYAKKMIHVLTQLAPKLNFDETKPNHILALSYAKANAALPKPMGLVSITRREAQYHDEQIVGTIASATAIRRAVLTNQTVATVVPVEMDQALLSRTLIDWERAYPFLRYRIVSTPIEILSTYYQVNEGIAHLFVQVATRANSFKDFLSQATSKSYPTSKIQRMAVYILLGMTVNEYEEAMQTVLFRPLAYTKVGQSYLKARKKNQVFTARIGKKEAQHHALYLKADQIYQLISPDHEEQNFGRFALLVNSKVKSV